MRLAAARGSCIDLMSAEYPFSVMIGELEREITARLQSYPGMVARGRLKQAVADRRIAILREVIATLAALRKKMSHTYLEQMAAEYTAMVEQRNAEIERHNAEIEQHNAEIEQRDAEIERRNTGIKQRNAEIEQRNAEIERHNAEIEQLRTALQTIIESQPSPPPSPDWMPAWRRLVFQMKTIARAALESK